MTDTKQPMDEELRTIYARVRAGVDPDTKQLHVTEEEFMQLIHQYGDTRETEGRLDEADRLIGISNNYTIHALKDRIAELKKTKEEKYKS